MEFIRFQSFEASASGLFSEDDVMEMELLLTGRPDAGLLIPHGRGLRKLRRPPRGHGKRGGARVIYYHVVNQGTILLIAAYAKNRQGDLTTAQLKLLSSIVKSEFP
jgi:hypothetical protein